MRIAKRRKGISLLIAAFVGAVVFWFITEPERFETFNVAAIEPDINNGELVFWAGGCASCHSAKDAEGEDKLKLGGGHALATPFGTFLTPNISPDIETGIGGWSEVDFLNAMVKGVSPDGEHYYPSFPYTSYARMTEQDVIDLFGYLKTLPPIASENQAHDLPLPFRWRRVLGGWKWLFADETSLALVPDSEVLRRGQYLVEGLGHCGECHTPRNLLGGLNKDLWLAGGPAPEGDGIIPNITAHASGIGDWSESDIAYYLESGFTPDFDSVGGSMVDVQLNMAKLPKSDLEAIAKYLKAVPAVSP